MSLSALLASPMRKSRPPGRPSADEVAGRKHHLRALDYLTNYKMTYEEVARMMGVNRRTIHRWVEKAARYPEAKQIFTRETPEIGN
jgi:predicted DNA-binding protein (UPF0251 family)